MGSRGRIRDSLGLFVQHRGDKITLPVVCSTLVLAVELLMELFPALGASRDQGMLSGPPGLWNDLQSGI
ncbi:hypothetical protein AAES_61124 [Amazona aestiva]|uniref:Uncharacterized protein n=1 Tax=Amazona aestiva TaxID=12930 RepID=A0A0Q3Q561_AMAAE|nr:hypothetical protein AAES_61124 [Amazona aestiva]